MIPAITDHVQQAVAKFLTPFRNKPLFRAWVAAPVRQLQLLEDAIWQFLAVLDVDNADLPRLILLGKIVGQTQRGTLEQFRTYVKARILVNRSRGKPADILRVASLLLGVPCWYSASDCTIYLEALGPSSFASGPDAVEFLNQARLGGVSLRLVLMSETDAFLFSGDAVTVYGFDPSTFVDTVHGFSDDAEDEGGHLAGIY